MSLQEKLFTRTYTNALVPDLVKTILPSDGIEALSIKCTSAVSAKVKGTRKLFGDASTDVNIAQNEVFNYAVKNGSDTITITIPQNCTIEISAY